MLDDGKENESRGTTAQASGTAESGDGGRGRAGKLSIGARRGGWSSDSDSEELRGKKRVLQSE